MDNNIRLIAVDLDGTLLNRKKEITPRTKEALAACAEAGIIDSFIDCLENDTEPSISGADVLAAMKAVFASIKSSEEGVRVTIDR